MPDEQLSLNLFYGHTGLVLMNAIVTQDCIHDPTFRHSSPSVFIRGDLMLKTRDLIYLSTRRLNRDDGSYLPQEYLHLVGK